MITKRLLGTLLFLTVIFFSCKDNKKEEADLNQKLDEIEAVEKTVDSTVNAVHTKAEEVKDLIKELDSI